jgi:hypothetical protein
MNPMTRLAAVAAVLAVAVGVTFLAIRGPSSGSPRVSPPPTILPTAAPPAATPRLLTGSDLLLRLPTGIYAVGEPFGVPFTLSLPDAWQLDEVRSDYVRFSQMVAPDTTLPLRLTVVRPSGVYADPCNGPPSPIGPSVDDLVRALTSVRGLSSTTVGEGLVGSAAAKTFTLDHPTGRDGCAGNAIPLMTQRSLGIDQDVDIFAIGRDQMFVLDVGGQRVLIDASTFDYSTHADLSTIHDLVQSIVFR